MSKNIKIEELEELAWSLKPILDTHNVPSELHYSIISDVIFQFANFIDERTGSSFHERIDGLIDKHFDKLSSQRQPDDWLIAELEILFGKGKKVEMNILRSHLSNRRHLMLDLEMALGVRDIDEIGKKIDTGAKFTTLMRRKNGIEALRFKPIRSEIWLSIPLNGSEHGDYEQSLSGILKCINRVAKQWV
jgi:hypothetical protein